MAEETAFGVSFGDPRRYMGKSPLGDVGSALKTFLTVTALEKSGAIGALDKLGIKPTKQGGFEFSNTKQPVPPITSGAAGDMMTNGVWGTNPMPVSPMSFSQMPAAIPSAAIPEQPAMPKVDLGPPPNVGLDVLDDKWELSEAEPIEKQDFNPLPSDMSNQMAMSPNAYQQVPGYGKLQKIASAIFGQG